MIGHELGHAMSGHAVYKTLLLRLLSMSGLLSAIPMGGLSIRMIIAALMEWSRKSELSADRAGLLATQDPADRVPGAHEDRLAAATSTTSTRRRSSPRARSTPARPTSATRC